MRVVLIVGADCVPLEIGKRDSERSLTETGKIQIEKSSDFLKKIGVFPECILVSPFIRSQETGRLLAEKLDNNGVVETLHLLMPGVGVDDLIKEISNRVASCSCLWLGVVIHQTDADYIIQNLFLGKGECRIPISPGLLIGLDINVPQAKTIDLLFVKYPVDL